MRLSDLEKLNECQKALDKFPKPDFSLDGVGVQLRVLLYDEWIKDFKEKFGVFQRELEDERKCNEIKMAAMLKALEQKHRELEGKISVDKKQLTERVLEIDKPSNNYGEVCKQNRQYRILLKELLAGSVGATK